MPLSQIIALIVLGELLLLAVADMVTDQNNDAFGTWLYWHFCALAIGFMYGLFALATGSWIIG